MVTLAPGMGYIDLHFLGRPRAIAAVVIYGAGGAVLIDPGPSSTLPALRAALGESGIAMSDLTAVLLTHIHLDHAGATGTLVREHPKLRVYVHQAGAPHMADPSKLLASATRLYGDAMDSLWGEFAPVPPHAMVALNGGERLEAGGRRLDVAYTPGHASHHVSFFSQDSGVAFVGDTAGVTVATGGYVLPPTPPPDIDLERWGQSLSVIESWHPGTLLLTHFGPSATATAHLVELRDHLALVAGIARRSLERDGDDGAMEAWFVDQLRLELRRHMSDADAAKFETSARFDLNWRGLARYWRKRGA
jgi:glyoxylase-like metal-dependent hydrolase (beta-lactamase superfamily II)